MNKCPHIEVRYDELRKVEMGRTGVTTRPAGWFCVWCGQAFKPTGEEQDHGPKPKSTK